MRIVDVVNHELGLPLDESHMRYILPKAHVEPSREESWVGKHSAFTVLILTEHHTLFTFLITRRCQAGQMFLEGRGWGNFIFEPLQFSLVRPEDTPVNMTEKMTDPDRGRYFT